LLQCRPNQQQRAEINLCNQNFEIYAPHIKVERIVRRQRVICEEAAFPGYLFIQLDPHSNWRALNSTRGVSKLVSYNGCPHTVPDELIAGLQQQFGAEERPVALFRVGDKVQVTDGCFINIKAIVKAVTPDERIVVLMNILHRQQAVTFTVTQLAKAG